MPGEILELFPAAKNAEIAPLGNGSGFSGAQLWRVRGPAGDFCLRAWPEGGMTPDLLSHIHHLIDQAGMAGLTFVPKIQRTYHDASLILSRGRVWDLTSWMPGTASFHQQPTLGRLAAACSALAQLHVAWRPMQPSLNPCPAVMRRLEIAKRLQMLIASGWQPDFSQERLAMFHSWAKRAWAILCARPNLAIALLTPWCGLAVPVQPCLCDIWHDHVLYTGDAVTGIIDYGSVKLDNVSVDLARLLGSLVGDDYEQRVVGLDAYANVRKLSAREIELVDVLDKTGTVLGAANWVRWVYHEGRVFEPMERAALRLAALVHRLEFWFR